MPWVLCGPICRHIAKLNRPNRNVLSQYKLTLAHANQLKGLSLVMEDSKTRTVGAKC